MCKIISEANGSKIICSLSEYCLQWSEFSLKQYLDENTVTCTKWVCTVWKADNKLLNALFGKNIWIFCETHDLTYLH